MNQDHEPAPLARSLSANFWWFFVGNAAYSFCQWMILVALAKLVAPLMLGKFALGLAVAGPILTFSNLQLRAIQATDAREQYRFSEYFGLRSITTAAGLLAIALIAFLGRFQPGTALIVLAVGMAKAVECFSDVFYGLFQHHEDLKRIAVSMILRGLMGAAALAAVVYLTRDVLWGTLAMMAVWAVVWAWHDFRWGRRMLASRRATDGRALRPHCETARSWTLFKLALPLGIVMVLVALNNNVPRYFVEYHMGEENLGIFSAMAYAMVALTGVGEALGQSAAPKLARYFADGQLAQFRSLVGRLLAIIAVPGAAAILVARFGGSTLLGLLYTPRYAQHADVFVWLMATAAATCAALLLSSAVTAARQFRIQVPMFTLAALTSAVGCYFLVPVAGMRGAAIAAAIGSTLHVLMASGVLAWVLLSSRAQQATPFQQARAESYVAPGLEA
ncbi:MAG: lipopolysaccharide biosynthesis protein [Bryobacteraceae bacterium]|jgi:O-antigen/teichoic acid export membrane protein